jgi:hypothetical protein
MTDYKLYAGQHEPGEGKRCAMEWVAYLAGEHHTDRPMCVDPQVGTFMRYLNDKLGDERRQMLRLYLARTIGTADDGHYAAKALSLGSDVTIRYWLDRLLPTVPLQLPVVADADQVCGVA